VTPLGEGREKGGNASRTESRRNAPGKQVGRFGQKATRLVSSRLVSTRPAKDRSKYAVRGGGMDGRVSPLKDGASTYVGPKMVMVKLSSA
jgi:hypothetical protein